MISNNFSDICGGNGYIRLLSNVCVKLSRVNCTLREATSFCSSDNATLFHIGTSDKYYSIIYLIKSMSGTFVIQDINIRFIFIVSFLYFSHGQVYSIQHNEIKCVSDLRNVTGFLFVLIFVTSHGQVYSIQPYEKVCQWPAECYWFSLHTYIFHFPWSGVLDTTLWYKVCQWPAECYWFSLCTYICHFPWSSVLDTTLWNKVCQWPAEGYWFSLSRSVSYTIQAVKITVTLC